LNLKQGETKMRNEELMKKWTPILEHEAFGGIQDSHRKAVTATILENTEKALNEGQSYSPTSLLEAAPANNINVDGAGGIDTYNPVLISLVRRAMPNLIAYDIAGVQPMTGPTGLIFAMRSRYGAQNGAEALYGEANTSFAPASTTAAAEALGDGVGAGFAEMSFSIEKVTVEAKSRALKAEYTTELAQDLKAIHGLDAETELANMLSAELLAEINREVVTTVRTNAVAGAQSGTASAGTFDLDVDANGRWSVEKFKGLMFQIEREANAIAIATRRGKGNMLICSSDVASALQMAGILDNTPALNSNNLSVDDTGNTFVGVLNGRYRVYIDPYAGSNFLVVGYKGSNAFDAGLFYCPYVPLQMVRAVGENSFQSKLGFKTRYGMVANPFAGAASATGAIGADSNVYYRRVAVTNIM
tara:strand:- start:10 stop:1257 length:1248 start_codon:yes stop_codon:yes gene_type:complete